MNVTQVTYVLSVCTVNYFLIPPLTPWPCFHGLRPNQLVCRCIHSVDTTIWLQAQHCSSRMQLCASSSLRNPLVWGFGLRFTVHVLKLPPKLWGISVYDALPLRLSDAGILMRSFPHNLPRHEAGSHACSLLGTFSYFWDPISGECILKPKRCGPSDAAEQG